MERVGLTRDIKRGAGDGTIERIARDSLQDLLHAEMQLVKALPEMADAARHPKLKELLTKHLQQTIDSATALF